MKHETTADDITQPVGIGQGIAPMYWNPSQNRSVVQNYSRPKHRQRAIPAILSVALVVSVTTACFHLYEEVSRPMLATAEFGSDLPQTEHTAPTENPHLVAAFPTQSRSVCGSDSNGADQSLYPIANTQVRIGKYFANSCGFVSNVASAVNAHVARNPDATDFPLTVRTPRTGGKYQVNCQREHHLSRCIVGGNADHVIYVQDAYISA